MPEPTRWRKKPVTVEAMQIGDNLAEAVDLYRWSGTELGLTVNGGAHGVEAVTVHTLEGDMTARPGDWIVKGVKGEVYPVRADIFADTYEQADQLVDWGRSERMDGSDSPRRVHTPTPDGWTAVQVQGGSKRGHTVHASKRAAEKDARRLAKSAPNVEVWVCPVIDGKVIWPGGTR